ncbi:MAG: SprT-like domain-containing protein [Flavobacteriales bacterium]|nr:SprT-like domain-containing protein [Flavobacteriales bacterium]
MNNLKKYIPSESVSLITKWITELNILVKIKKSRSTKLGDFRVNRNDEYHISINNDLNKYAFLITLTHEIAHAFVWEKYKRTVSPHGVEWKNTFKKMMLNFLNSNVFPDDILRVLSNHLKNPKASTANDYNLSSVLKNYDKNQKQTIDEIPDGSVFSTTNGKQFIKIEKLRKRYKCKAIDSKRVYLFNPLAVVALSHNK